MFPFAGQSVQRRRPAPFGEWSPSIHYAKFQTLPPGALPLRRLYDFELLYVQQGEASVDMDGQRFLLGAGQLIFLSSGVYHQNAVVSSPCAKFLGIHFDFFDEVDIIIEEDMVVNEEAVQQDRFAYEAVAESFAPLSESPIYAPSPGCIQLMEQLVEEFTMRRDGHELACKGLILSILAQLLRSQRTRARLEASLHGDSIAGLMEAIEAAPGEAWSNVQLAAVLNMNVDYMSRLFKQMAGLPPGEYVSAVRHREARKLLRESDLSIEEVGREVGYDSLHYFSRVFRQHEGIPPREYRKLSRIL